MNIVIPMAGKSERFFKYGYTLPKALLPLGTKTTIERIINLFDTKNDRYFFIVNKIDNKRYGLSKFLNTLKINKKILVIPRHNLGPVYSLLKIKDAIPPDEEVLVNYCDVLISWNYRKFLQTLKVGGYDGGLASFKGFHPASLGDTYFAYMKVNSRNELVDLREKASFTDNRMQEHASTGTYYFKKWGHVLKFGRELIKMKIHAHGEYYVSLMYNLMKKAGLKSLVFETEKFISLGAPEDYRQYQYWQDIFVKDA